MNIYDFNAIFGKIIPFIIINVKCKAQYYFMGHCGRDRMVVRFTTTCVTSAYCQHIFVHLGNNIMVMLAFGNK